MVPYPIKPSSRRAQSECVVWKGLVELCKDIISSTESWSRCTHQIKLLIRGSDYDNDYCAIINYNDYLHSDKMTMIILQMPELEDLGCVGAFDSRATEFNIEVFRIIKKWNVQQVVDWGFKTICQTTLIQIGIGIGIGIVQIGIGIGIVLCCLDWHWYCSDWNWYCSDWYWY